MVGELLDHVDLFVRPTQVEPDDVSHGLEVFDAEPVQLHRSRWGCLLISI